MEDLTYWLHSISSIFKYLGQQFVFFHQESYLNAATPPIATPPIAKPPIATPPIDPNNAYRALLWRDIEEKNQKNGQPRSNHCQQVNRGVI